MQLLIAHAKIHTMNPAQPRAEAAVVSGGRFAYVGTEKGALAFLAGAAYERLDAGGASVTPGFNDSHMHLAGTAMRMCRVMLEDARSIGEAQAMLRAGLDTLHEGWLLARGWNQEDFAEKRPLTRADLDAVSPDLPIVATRACGHILAANSRALAIAGVDCADGILREDDMGLVGRHIPPETLEMVMDAMLDHQSALFAKGITSVQSDDLDGSLGEQRRFVHMLRDASDDGRLKVRYALQARPDGLSQVRAFLENGLHTVRGRAFHTSCIKLMADGSLGARTALLETPYDDAPDTLGIGMLTEDELAEIVREGTRHGIPCAVHAIGDGAMERVLSAFARGGQHLRHAVVHAQITTEAQLRRVGAMRLSILAQPIFLRQDAPIVMRRVGAARAESSYRWRSMLGAGACVAFGTDSPVEAIDVMPGLYHAMARHYLPDEAFTLDEALYAYTAAGAYASGEETQKGRIQPGMLADFALLDRPLTEDAETVRGATVRYTFVDGECVYSA